jgi:hypothetical protein
MRLSIAASLLALGACTTVPATMAGFDEVAGQSEVVAVKGVGWARSGDFTIEPLGVSGRFTRSANESGAGDVQVARGHVRFQLAATGEFGGLSGDCWHARETIRHTDRLSRRVEIETSVVTGPLIYSCDFFDRDRQIGALELHERVGDGLEAAAMRDGVAEAGGERMTLRSVHKLARSRWPSNTPLGYAMRFGDGAEAMLYSNGPSRYVALPRAGADRRVAALLAGLALTLAWDPGA